MKGERIFAAALLGTTALTPVPAAAGPVLPFVQGIGAVLGLGVTAPAIGSAAFSAFLSGTAFASAITGSWIGQTLLSIGLSAVAQSLAPRPNVTSPSERLVNFAAPATPTDWVFGRVRKGGPYIATTFIEDRRHYAIGLAGHRIDGVEAWYLDQRPVVVDEDGEVTSAPYWKDGKSAVNLRFYDGAPGQAADPDFVSMIPEWTTAHDMAGLSYIAAWARRVGDGRFHKVYGNSPQTGPSITAVIRGALVYDPRTDETVWANNAALVWAWITTERLGGTVDWDHVAAQADICDTVVLDRNGTELPKWTLNGTFSDTTDYETLRAQIIAACDGYVFERPDGSLGLIVGGYTEPEITLTEAAFYSVTISENDWGPSPPSEYVGRYVNPLRDWNEGVTGVWVADLDAEVNRREVPLYFADNHNQAIRCLKRIASASRPQFTLTGEIGLIGYELAAHRFVRITVHGYDFVAEIGRLGRGESLATVRIEAVSVTEADFEFNAATEEPAPPPGSDMEGDDDIPTPAAITGDALTGLQIRWTWDAQREDLRQELAVRNTVDSEWPGGVILSEGTTEYVTAGHVEGESYEARLRNITPANRAGDWVESDPVLAVSSLVPPDPPSNLSASLDLSITANGSVKMPNDPAATGVRIYRHDGGGGPDFEDATLVLTIYGAPSATLDWSDGPLSPSTEYNFWAVAINASATESTPVGPETVTST